MMLPQNRRQPSNGSKIIVLIVFSLIIAMVFNISIPQNRKFIFASNGIYVFDTENAGKSLRCLTFSPETEFGLQQGCIFKKYPEKLPLEYTRLMIKGVAFAEKKDKILMLGMGIGTIPKAISSLYPNSKIDIIEIEPSIPEIAEKFFYFKKTENMKIFIEDAYDFILNSEEKYDIILMDIFDKTYIPPQFLTEKFVLDLKKRLTENGLLIVNTFSSSPYFEEEGELFLKFFEYNFQIKSANRIIFVSDAKINDKD